MEFLKGPEKRNKPNVVASHYGKTSRLTSSNFALRLDATDVHAQYHIFGEIYIREPYQRQPQRFAKTPYS